jgi:23S rRNA (uracil-5-)-methyltransferase RumA (EC 2.1.1.-)
LLNFLQDRFPEITSLVYAVNTKLNDTIYDLPVVLHAGRPFIYERLGTIKYKISPKSFFQTNTEQALRLYQIAADFADLKGDENVYDLYTGTGSIACFIASRVRQVVGIEEVDMAVVDARQNAVQNHLQNVVFYTGDVKDILTPRFSEKHGKPDVVITDPPRAGMHVDVVQTLLQLESPRVVYVSCNPATQARDVALLASKYDLLKLQPVDMFPHTHHVESVALLQLRK